VIDQTFVDWEFIIINDCSKDKSADIIKSFHDVRIRFFENETNCGQCDSLNFGILQAKGKYIARLDHDDICYPDRFQKQFDYMESHRDVVLCGAWYDLLQEGSIIKQKCPEIMDSEEVKFSLPFFNFMAHSSFMIRRDAMIDNNIQYGIWKYAEDFDLLLKMFKVGKVDYIHESLIAYRVFSEQCTQTSSYELKFGEKNEIRNRYFNSLNLEHKLILQKAGSRELDTIKDYREFLNGLIIYAKYCKIDSERKSLKENVCFLRVYRDICISQQYNWALLISYLASPYKMSRWLLSGEGLRFIIKCIIHYHHKW
jgi:glycosyltransferase involved in cell wall biosynthesis